MNLKIEEIKRTKSYSVDTKEFRVEIKKDNTIFDKRIIVRIYKDDRGERYIDSIEINGYIFDSTDIYSTLSVLLSDDEVKKLLIDQTLELLSEYTMR